jgi:hypothetical protein
MPKSRMFGGVSVVEHTLSYEFEIEGVAAVLIQPQNVLESSKQNILHTLEVLFFDRSHERHDAKYDEGSVMVFLFPSTSCMGRRM